MRSTWELHSKGKAYSTEQRACKEAEKLATGGKGWERAQAREAKQTEGGPASTVAV